MLKVAIFMLPLQMQGSARGCNRDVTDVTVMI
jgi:hypothetical protein